MKKLWGNKWSMSWRPIPQEICWLKYVIENPCGDICHEKTLTKMSCPKAICFGGEIPQDTAFILKILCERYAIKQSVKGNCLPNKVRMEISSKQIPKETSTKEYLEKPAYKKKPKEKSLRKKSEGKTLPQKKSNNLSTSNYVKKFYQGNSEETFPAKLKFEIKISQNICLKRHFPTKQIEETSLRKEHLKRNLYQKEWRNISKKSEKRNITSNMARIGTDKIWWNNAFFLQISSISIFAVFHVENNLIFWGEDFSWICFW